VLTGAVKRAGKRLFARIDEARARGEDEPGHDAVHGEDAEHALHEARKAAKRVRYTAEVAAPVLGPPAEALVTCMKQVQDVLGEAQDTVVTRAWCLRLATAAVGAGEDTFTYGRLHGLEEARAEHADRAFWALEPSLRAAVKAAAKA
jgi:CHAD domain-containing protein